MDADYQTILYDDSLAPVARITLNRPSKRNPLSPQTISELVGALGRAAGDEAIGALIITGAGKVFSAGGDLSLLSESPPTWDDSASLTRLFETMHGLGKPIIAMVNGHAMAGGLGLVVACDLAISADTASFAMSEIKVGLWPMMITSEITRNVGRKKVLELMLTGRRIDAQEAERIGLINQVVAADELEETTLALAAELAAKSPTTLARGLRSFYDTQDMDYSEALSALEESLKELLKTDDAREGLQAFVEKRAPIWGRRK